MFPLNHSLVTSEAQFGVATTQSQRESDTDTDPETCEWEASQEMKCKNQASCTEHCESQGQQD